MKGGGWSEPVDMTPRALHPTPNRLELLRQVDNDQVMVDITTEDGSWRVVLFPNAPTEWQTQQTVTARVDELERAGWIREVEPLDFELTEAGRQVLAAAAGRSAGVS